jgi:shikimate kinase
VHLTVGLSDGLRRTGMSTARPLLAGVNPRATFKALLDARAPLYAEVATVVVDTSRRSANQVARAVLEAVGELAPNAPPDPVDTSDPLDVPTPYGAAAGAAPLPDPTLRP